jgi:aminoglycoside phosphotransferase (APT) family kinase protein
MPDAPLPIELRRWVEARTGGRVAAARRLTGGITSSVHRLTITTPSGLSTDIVLRRWDDHHPGAALAQEARILRLLERTDIPAPRLLGVSDGLETGGTPAVLMTRIPGRLDLSPKDPRSWLQQMAEMLARIQDLDLDFPGHQPSCRPDPTEIPEWVEQPEVWRAALTLLQEPPPEDRLTFTHADFQHFNLLWSRGRLTGVVDWAFPAVASPDLDVGHCRLNLTILFGAEFAEGFWSAYESAAGRRVQPWWDLHRLTGYSPEWQSFIPRQVAGRVPVDVSGMTRRVEDAMARTLARV